MDIKPLLSHIELELQKQVSRLDQPRTKNFHEMLTYHMGWTGEGAGPEATGKRIRPLLVLLTTASCGAITLRVLTWQSALPAAAAVELVHNFSLVHDDIQDNSPKRRGRDTAWVKWGAPMAINAGDALFVMSNQAIIDLKNHYPAEIVVQAAEILHNTCLELTRGQYLDMSYEERKDLAVEDYWPMISGKTSALLSACCHIGALLGGADEEQPGSLSVRSDIIWVSHFKCRMIFLASGVTRSQPANQLASDLVEGKNSLPVLAGLRKKGKFAERWAQGPIKPEEVEELARVLASEDGYGFAKEASIQMTDMAINSLREADPQGEAGEALFELTNKLLNREQ